MSTLSPDPAPDSPPAIDYKSAEGFDDAAAAHAGIEPGGGRDRVRREWLIVVLGLCGLITILAIVLAVIAVAGNGETKTVRTASPPARPTPATADKPAPTLADAKGIDFEKFTKVDPTLPPVPAGAVKKFKVDVFQHVTQVSKDLAPTEVWSFAINGKYHRGSGVSGPM
ncbi:MAG: hypothetical protein M3O90_03745, partial [Actinomycetota bacterium]|nr:hypothetical protein [Actinomycetota bacterium]